MTAATGPDPAAWGVELGYHDVAGNWHDAPADSVQAVLDAMGADTPRPPGLGDDNPVWVVGDDEDVSVDGRWHVRTEDGDEVVADGVVPRLPLGYHRLDSDDGRRTVRLIVSPRRCHPVGDDRGWGWAVQLYALRSNRSWGIGDLGDLHRFAAWAHDTGASTILLNPLHAALPGLPQPDSPYYPSSRCFRNPLYLDMTALGATAIAGDAAELNRRRMIDRDAVHELKLEALEAVWAQRNPTPGFDRYQVEQGELLERFGTFCALAEVHGRPWNRWPENVRRPDGDGVAEFRRDFADRIRFHQWLQWLVDNQLESASSAAALMHDVAVGVDPAGADAWMWQDVFALGARVGAPPDEFNTAGQDWGLPPFDPWQLRGARFEPFIRTVRAACRHAGAIRVDHVMGLFRLFWIPPGGSPADGVYVRYPSTELLDILALESVRAGAYVVGEDLGTVEDEVRLELARRNVLSYRLLYFEPHPPRQYPAAAMAAVTTHDLPTVAGLWTGADLDAQRAAGVEPNEASTNDIVDRIAGWAGVPTDAETSEVVRGCYTLLAEAPSKVVVATLDDALEVCERPNMPGTIDEYPNWRLALPYTLEDIVSDKRVLEVGRLLGSGRAPSGDATRCPDAGQGDP